MRRKFGYVFEYNGGIDVREYQKSQKFNEKRTCVGIFKSLLVLFYLDNTQHLASVYVNLRFLSVASI